MPKQQSALNFARMDRKWWVLFSVGIGTFMSALDASVVNTILPVIRREFECEVASVQWAITVYLLAVSALLLLFGRLGDLRGQKLVYTSGFGIFVAGSALCGLSPGVISLNVAKCNYCDYHRLT